MISRILNLNDVIAHRSVFLFGPRQTGKSTLLRSRYSEAKYYDLLHDDTFRELSANPETIRYALRPNDRLIIIDEVQKLPVILDEVHSMIERNKDLRFILTGSSARKLRRGGANLLGGRAWTRHLHPLVAPELEFGRLAERINYGGLPAILESSYPQEDLFSYIGNYLREEIAAEGLVRSIEKFSRFLPVSAMLSGEQVNITEVASDCGVSVHLVREYMQILEDTLIGYQVPSYMATKRRKAVAKSKFYLFDVGVTNTLLKRPRLEPGTELYGRALEHLIFVELRAYLDYTNKHLDLHYWRTLSQIEVDFVLGDEVAIEVKAKARITKRDMKGLLALAEEIPLKRKIVVSLGRTKLVLDNRIEIYPVEEFFRDLWSGALI